MNARALRPRMSALLKLCKESSVCAVGDESEFGESLLFIFVFGLFIYIYLESIGV